MSAWQWIATTALVVVFLSFAQLIYPGGGVHPTGGAIGYWTLGLLQSGVGRLGAGLVLLGLGVILFTLAAQLRWQALASWSVERVEILVPQVRAKSSGFAGWCWASISGRSVVVSQKWQGAMKRMWESLTRQDTTSNFDTTWAEDVGTTHVTDVLPETGIDNSLDIAGAPSSTKCLVIR